MLAIGLMKGCEGLTQGFKPFTIMIRYNGGLIMVSWFKHWIK